MANNQLCLLCCSNEKRTNKLIEIDKQTMPKSNKTIKSVLLHLSKCIKKEYNFDYFTLICNSCFVKLSNYDEIMVRLLDHQKELSRTLEESMKTLKNFNLKIKKESIANENDILFNDTGSHVGTNFKEELAINCSFNDDNDNDDFLDSSSSEDDEKTNYDPMFACTSCDKKCKSLEALQNHLKNHNDFVSCTICGETRKDEEYLELHMNVHEGKTERECRYCDKKFSRRCHVIRHMQTHWNKKNYQCEKCGLTFCTGSAFYNHRMNHDTEDNPLICNVCNQKFKTQRTFKHHMIIHQEDRPMFPCEICGKVFTQKYTIKAHLRTHQEGYQLTPSSTKKAKPKVNEIPKMCIICNCFWPGDEALEKHMADDHDVIRGMEYL